MKKSVVLFVGLLPFAVFAQTVADPAYANMQRAMGGIIQQAAVNRGVSTTDPRTYATLYGVGKSAAVGAAAAGAGFLVAGTSPAWGTILAVAAVSGAVSYGVSLGIDSVVKWSVGPSASAPITSSVTPAKDGSWTPVAGGQCSFTNVSSWCPGGGTYSACLLPGAYNPTLPCSSNWASYGFSGPASTVAGAMSIAGYTDVKPPSVVPNLSLTQAISALTAAQKATAVSYDSMALMINDLWAKAAAQPDYAGVPYVQTSPVTAFDVQAWAQANPSAYPTVEALVSPVGAPSGFAPSVTSSPGSSVTPATSPTSPYAPSTGTGTGTTEVTVNLDLGPDPGVGSPSLDSPDWLTPLLNMLPGWTSVTFSAQGECLKPSVNLNPWINKVIVMESHCGLFESQRQAISVIMTAIWLMASAFIFLRA